MVLGKGNPNDKRIALLKLESELEALIWDIREAAITALGRVFPLLDNDEDRKRIISKLEPLQTSPFEGIREKAITVLRSI